MKANLNIFMFLLNSTRGSRNTRVHRQRKSYFCIQESIQINRINKTNFQIIGDNIRTISVMNLVGKQLYSQPVESTNTTINLNDLCSGVYIVEAILNNGRKIVSKQIIQ